MNQNDIEKILQGLSRTGQTVDSGDFIVNGLTRPLGFNIMEPAVKVPQPETRYRLPSSEKPKRPYDPMNPFKGMTGEEMSEMYKQHQNALLNIGGRKGDGTNDDLPIVNDQTAPIPFFSLAWWGRVGEDLDTAGQDALRMFYQGTERAARNWGEWTAPKPIDVPKRQTGLSTDSFTDPEFEPLHGMGPKEAPYAFAGMRSAVGVLSGIPHLLGGIGAIRDAYSSEGFAAGNAAVGEAGIGFISTFNPFDPNIDGPERFHRSLNLLLLGSGSAKGLGKLREGGAVKTLVKEHGFRKNEAQFIVKEVQKGLKEIDAEVGGSNIFERTLDSITQNKLRSIIKTIDPESFVLETLNRKPYVPVVTPTVDMNAGHNLIGDEVQMPFKENNVFAHGEAAASPTVLRMTADRIQKQADSALIDFINTGDPARQEMAAALNGRAAFLRDQAALKERAAKTPKGTPNLSPTARTSQPAAPGDGGGPAGSLGDPIDVPPAMGQLPQSGRIGVAPITEGDVIRDNTIWTELFKKLKVKPPRIGDDVAKGKFDPKQAAMVVRTMRNSSTVAHEVGHLFDEVFKLTEDVPEGELKALVGKLKVEDDVLNAEAAAEFVRGMMINPDEAAVRAPTMLKNWNERVPQNYRDAMGEAGLRIRRVMGQDARDLTLGQVRLQHNTVWETIKDARKDKKRSAWKEGTGLLWEKVITATAKLDTTKPYSTPMHRILQAWAGNDDLAALQAAQEYIKEVRHLSEFMPEEDAALLAARHRYINSQVAETVAGGVRDQYGQVMYHSSITGLMQQIGKQKLKIGGSEVELPIVRQLEEGNAVYALGEDGVLYDLNGTRHDYLGVAEPLTLKWVLQPLRGAKDVPNVMQMFEDFVVKGVSERALELHERFLKEKLPGLVDELEKVAPAEAGKHLEATINATNKEFAQLYPDAEVEPLTVTRYRRMLNGLDELDEVGQLAHGQLIDRLSPDRWRSKGAKDLVSQFKQDSVAITGAGRGLYDDVSVAMRAKSNLRTDELLFVTEALRRYRSYSDAILRKMVHDGLLDGVGYEGIKANNKDYFDLGRVMDEVSDLMEVPRYHVEEVKALTGRAKGSMREIEAPVVNLMANTEQAIRLGERNRVLNTFLDPIRNATDPLQRNLLASVAEKVDAPGKHTIRVINRGVTEYWQMEPALFDAFKPDNLLSGIPKILLKVASLPRDMLLKGVTYMPDFVVRNAFRDFMDTKIKGRGISTKEFFNALAAAPEDVGFYDYFGGGIAIWDDVAVRKGWHRLQKDVLGQIEKEPPGDAQITFVEGVGETWSLPKSHPVGRRLKTQRGWWNQARSRAERATRLAEYRKAFEEAKSQYSSQHPDWEPERVEYNAHLKAGQSARDIIDFARGSKIGKGVNRMIPFFNARIQGFSSTVAAVQRAWRTGDKAGMKALGLRMLTTMGTLSAAEFAINKLMGSEESWRDQPSYLKDLYWLFPAGKGSNVWIRIPKPFEFGIMASIFPRVVYNDWDGFLTEDGSIRHGSVVSMLSPVAFDDLLYGPAQTVVELSHNYDEFRRNNIIPPHERDLALELRDGRHNASNIGKVLSMGQVDPRYVDHALTGFFGSAGRTAQVVSGPMNAESPPRWINALVGLTTTDGSSNNSDVRKALRRAANVGVTNLFTAEYQTLREARNGDIFTGGPAVWKAKQSIVEKAKKINALIDERTEGKDSKEQLEIMKAILKDFSG